MEPITTGQDGQAEKAEALGGHTDKTRLSSAHDLLRHGLIWDGDFAAVEEVGAQYAIGVTPHIADLIRANPQSDAIWKQYIPQEAELFTTRFENADPIGDNTYTPVKGIVHRYPDRVLLKVVNGCAVYCRYCFRRDMIGPGSEPFDKQDREAALNYIRTHKQIWEVILTGGDPFVLSPRQMGGWLEALSAIDHVRIVRIHTRVPVADPLRITPDYIAALQEKCKKSLYIVLHVNHPDEINAPVAAALAELHKAGCTLLSQSVLLRGVNDHAGTLERLFRALLEHHVKPYYLHHPDLAKGTAHFRLPLKQGMAIYRALLGRISGLCQPSYVLDIPGGYGKTPINASYIEDLGGGHYRIEDYLGHKHDYIDDPGENATSENATGKNAIRVET